MLVLMLVLIRFWSRYLEVEWEVRQGTQRGFGKEVMKGSSPRVPQQDNFSDCGVYVLQYVESFFEVRAVRHLVSNSHPLFQINSEFVCRASIFVSFLV